MKTRRAGLGGFRGLLGKSVHAARENCLCPYVRRLRVELLEDRRMLDAAVELQAIELFGTSPALFVENQGQWEDESIRYAFQGSGANVLLTDTGPVFQLFQREGVAIERGAGFQPAKEHGTLQTCPTKDNRVRETTRNTQQTPRTIQSGQDLADLQRSTLSQPI